MTDLAPAIKDAAFTKLVSVASSAEESWRRHHARKEPTTFEAGMMRAYASVLGDIWEIPVTVVEANLAAGLSANGSKAP